MLQSYTFIHEKSVGVMFRPGAYIESFIPVGATILIDYEERILKVSKIIMHTNTEEITVYNGMCWLFDNLCLFEVSEVPEWAKNK